MILCVISHDRRCQPRGNTWATLRQRLPGYRRHRKSHVYRCSSQIRILTQYQINHWRTDHDRLHLPPWSWTVADCSVGVAVVDAADWWRDKTMVGSVGQGRYRAVVDQAELWQQRIPALVDQTEAGCRRSPAVVGRAPVLSPPTGSILVVVSVGGPGPRMMSESPEAAVPGPPSCPDRRLHQLTGQARTLPHREAQKVPVVRVLPGTPESAGLARQLAREFLGDAHQDADVVVLIVSELVTNAVTHSKSAQPGGTLTVSLCGGSDGLFVQVRDDGGPSGQWETTLPGTAAEHGYGLLLVDALSDSWGTACDADGRVTWCRVRGEYGTPGRHRAPGQRVVP